MRVVFMGTPSFAVPSLHALVGAGHEIALVVTQQARPAGRGRQSREPQVAIVARELGLPIFQPERVRRPDAVARLAEAAPDAIVVAAFGQILPAELLAIPPHGSLNVHPSLLPRHRGAAPIAGALLAGDRQTGVSIMLMDEGMDTGPVLAQSIVDIADEDDAVSLSESLASLGGQLLIETLGAWASGQVTPQPQDPALVTLTRPTTRADGLLNWHEAAEGLWRRIRAYADWPIGSTTWSGRLFRIRGASCEMGSSGPPGLVAPREGTSRSRLGAAIGTGKGWLIPQVVGLEGGRLMEIDAFLRGHPAFVGAQLGDG